MLEIILFGLVRICAMNVSTHKGQLSLEELNVITGKDQELKFCRNSAHTTTRTLLVCIVTITSKFYIKFCSGMGE